MEKFISAEKEEVGENTSHVVLTTHNPMAIAELEREQVQILTIDEDENSRRVAAVYPEESPRGMGYASIITSDMFGIASTLDRETQELLEQQRELGSKDVLNPIEALNLTKINRDLDRLGFRFHHPDDEYTRYLTIRSEALHQRFEAKELEDVVNGVARLSLEEREKIAREVIAELLREQEEADGE
ncbi:MAG: hypothetical protein RLN85_13905 [Pseudomonadales bacterium]